MKTVVSSTDFVTFDDVRKPYRNSGIDGAHLLPLVPRDAKLSAGSKLDADKLGKIPGAYDPNADDWRGLHGAHFREGLTPEIQAKAASWPTRNMGVRGAVFPGIDSDVGTATARRLVDDVIRANFVGWDGEDFAVRTRGTSQRQLYAFRARVPGQVASIGNAVVFTLPDDPAGMKKPHVVEIKGASNHWVAEGQHPEGEWYEWLDGADLATCVAENRLIELGNDDMARLVPKLVKAIEDEGGKIEGSGSTGSGGGGSGPLRDYSNDDPIMPVDVILEGLTEHFHNTRANIPHHDEKSGGFVSVLAQIRAALGREANDPEVFAEVEAWATAHEDDTGADEAYFAKTWASLDSGVRVDPWSLDAHFRRIGYHEGAQYAFPTDEASGSAIVHNKEWAADAGNRLKRLLGEAAKLFHFRDVNTATRDTETAKIRHSKKVRKEKNAYSWWLKESTLKDSWIVDELHVAYGKGPKEWSIKAAFWRFQRDLIELHPEAFFENTCKNPIEPLGARVARVNEEEETVFDLNVIAIPKVQRLGGALPPGAWKKGAAWVDVQKLLNLQRHQYGPYFEFELRSQAFMAQRKKRVGHWVFLVGPGGCGKSITSTLNCRLYNGVRSHFVQGNSLVRAEGARFAFIKLEGARCFEAREIPRHVHADAKELFVSVIKQAVDAGLSGDTIKVEPKGVDSYEIPNYARIFGTSNYPDSNILDNTENERRTFMVISGITKANREQLVGDLDAFDELERIIADEERLAYYWRMLLDQDIEGYQPKAAPPVTFGKAEAELASIQKPFKRHAAVAAVMFWAAGREMIDADELWHWMQIIAENERIQSNGVIDHTALYKVKRDANGNRVKRDANDSKVAMTGLDEKYELLRDNMKADGPDRTPIPNIYAHVDAQRIREELAQAPKPEDGGRRAPSNASKARVLQALADDRERHPVDPMQHLPGPYRPKLGDDFSK